MARNSTLSQVTGTGRLGGSERMGGGLRHMSSADRAFLDRLSGAVMEDECLTALFLGGSHASGSSDEHSDLDLYLVTTDAGFEPFAARRHAFMRQLGDVVFLEEHQHFGFLMLLYMYADGVHGEMAVAPARDIATIHAGPHHTLQDKTGLLEGYAFPPRGPDDAERQQAAREILVWFWYDRRLLEVALARGQLWTAHYYLERCRRATIDLVRLRTSPEAWPGGYEKVEGVVPEQDLAELAATVVPLRADAMRDATRLVTRIHTDVGREVAAALGIEFPEEVRRLVLHGQDGS